MKNGILTLGLILGFMPAFCQLANLSGKESSNEKIRFGVKSGLAIGNSRIKYNQSFPIPSGPKKTALGWMAGIFARTSLQKNTWFQPELLIVRKVMKENSQYRAYRSGLTYLELPLNILYNKQAGKGSYFIGAGPAPAIYIGDGYFFAGYNSIKKFDVGSHLLMGYEFALGFSINLSYSLGMINISQNKTDIPMIKNRYGGIAVGYYF